MDASTDIGYANNNTLSGYTGMLGEHVRGGVAAENSSDMCVGVTSGSEEEDEDGVMKGVCVCMCVYIHIYQDIYVCVCVCVLRIAVLGVWE